MKNVVFDESDGIEIDDNECLLAYEKGTVFILRRYWRPAIATEEFKEETNAMGKEHKDLTLTPQGRQTGDMNSSQKLAKLTAWGR